MKTHHEPLPSEWIDMIFSKLTLRYGRDFLGRYEGQDLAAVKSDWATELAGLQNRPEAITYALEYPSARAPNVVEFIAACRRAPVAAQAQIAPPKANAEIVAKALAMAAGATGKRHDPLAPIRELRRRELAGDRTLTKAQREFWRIALKAEMGNES